MKLLIFYDTFSLDLCPEHRRVRKATKDKKLTHIHKYKSTHSQIRIHTDSQTQIHTDSRTQIQDADEMLHGKHLASVAGDEAKS